MTRNRVWLKSKVLEYLVFPQLPSFCGVAACCGALGCVLGRRVTEQSLHASYEIGRYTKLRAPADCPPEEFATLPRSGRGFSNWDVIRLANAVLLDEGMEPSAAILCGEDFVRETGDADRLGRILDWLADDSRHAVVHTVNHYTLLAGAFRRLPSDETHLLLADSSARTGPLRSLPMSDLTALARGDERYGFVLVSNSSLPRSLFSSWSDAMTPAEVTGRQRFARTGES